MISYEMRVSDLEYDLLPTWVTDKMRRQLISARWEERNTIVSADGKGRVEFRNGRVFVVDRTRDVRRSQDPAPTQPQTPLSDHQTETSRQRRIVSPPGHTWVRLLSFVYPARTYQRVFAPHIADMRRDHAEALLQRQLRKAKWITFRDNAVVVPMILMHLPRWVFKLAAKAWSPPTT